MHTRRSYSLEDKIGAKLVILHATLLSDLCIRKSNETYMVIIC